MQVIITVLSLAIASISSSVCFMQVIIHLGGQRISDGNLMKRWTTGARDVLPLHMAAYRSEAGSMQSKTFRHNMLYMAALELVQQGDLTMENFHSAMEGIEELKRKLASAQPRSASTEGTNDNSLGQSDDTPAPGVPPTSEQSCMVSSAPTPTIVEQNSPARNGVPIQPPEPRRCRGRPTNSRLKHPADNPKRVARTRFCKKCNKPGHNSATCIDGERNHEAMASGALHVEASKGQTHEARASGALHVDSNKVHTKVCSRCHIAGHMKTTCGKTSSYVKQGKCKSKTQ